MSEPDGRHQRRKRMDCDILHSERSPEQGGPRRNSDKKHSHCQYVLGTGLVSASWVRRDVAWRLLELVEALYARRRRPLSTGEDAGRDDAPAHIVGSHSSHCTAGDDGIDSAALPRVRTRCNCRRVYAAHPRNLHRRTSNPAQTAGDKDRLSSCQLCLHQRVSGGHAH